MSISTEKPISMVISKDPVRCKLEVEGTIIEKVMGFPDLGIDIISDSYTYKEVREQAIKGARASGSLKDVTWKLS